MRAAGVQRPARAAALWSVRHRGDSTGMDGFGNPARDVRVRAHFPRHGRVAQMDLVAVHERATELIAEVERARDERQTKFRPLAFFSAMFSRSFWRLALRSLRTGSSLSDASPEVRIAYERVFGGPPE